MKKVRWGIVSTAKIGVAKVIPAMQKGTFCEVTAIASRNVKQATAVAEKLGIAKAYGSYEELLADKEIDSVYIPLPNHLHVEWATRAIAANKHVLCEKPIGMFAEDALELAKAAKQSPELKVMEAFMYRFHPQWHAAKAMVAAGKIGTLKTVQSFFSYYNVDMNNIRNQKEAGGGGIMDIGCYCISFARFLFEREPVKVVGMVEFDPTSETDRLASGMLDFGNGTSTFTCSTQLMPYQRVNILGTDGRIEIEIPVNAPPDEAVKIWLHTKSGSEVFTFEAVDQYTLQGDAFSLAILEDKPVPTPLEDAISNMKVIDGIFKSAETGAWVKLDQ